MADVTGTMKTQLYITQFQKYKFIYFESFMYKYLSKFLLIRIDPKNIFLVKISVHGHKIVLSDFQAFQDTIQAKVTEGGDSNGVVQHFDLVHTES